AAQLLHGRVQRFPGHAEGSPRSPERSAAGPLRLYTFFHAPGRIALFREDVPMIAYDPKTWCRDLFSIHGTVLPGVLGRLCLYALLTVGLWLWNTYGKPIPALDPLGHQTIGVALGLLIVLRTNASYDRWWEGRKLWGGMVNASRNLVRSAAAYAGPADDLANL